MRVAPGLSPSSVSLVQKAGSQQKGDNALISYPASKGQCSAYALPVGYRCSCTKVFPPLPSKAPGFVQTKFSHGNHPAIRYPCVQPCLAWEYLILLLLLVLWLGYNPGKLHNTHWMSPLFLEKRKARGNPGELVGARGSKSWAMVARDGYKGAGSTRALLSLPQLPAAQRGFVLGQPHGPAAQIYCWRGDVQGFWARAPVTQTATTTSAPFTRAQSRFPCQRPSHGAVLGMVLSLPGSLQGTHIPSHLGLTAHLPGIIHKSSQCLLIK